MTHVNLGSMLCCCVLVEAKQTHMNIHLPWLFLMITCERERERERERDPLNQKKGAKDWLKDPQLQTDMRERHENEERKGSLRERLETRGKTGGTSGKDGTMWVGKTGANEWERQERCKLRDRAEDGGWRDRERCMYIYIYMYAVKLLSGPSLAILGVILWAK